MTSRILVHANNVAEPIEELSEEVTEEVTTNGSESKPTAETRSE